MPFPPHLPLLVVGVRYDVVLEKQLKAVGVVCGLPEPSVLLSCDTYAELYELESDEFFVWVVSLVLQLDIGRDKQAVYC